MIPEKQQSVVIVAGGKGLRAFYDFNHKIRIVVVLPKDCHPLWVRLCDENHFDILHTVVYGGETRFHSVKNGLKEIPEEETVGVHDGARPFVTPALIGRCFNAAFENQCGVIPVVDEPNSIRQLTGTGSRSIDRGQLKVVQTPQVFPSTQLKKAYETAFDTSFTDDASVAEKWGMHIMLVDGVGTNIKITTPFDMTIADCYCKWMAIR